jgi:hypothetical protein
MLIWKDVTGSLHEQFEMVSGREQIIEDDIII